MDQYRQTLNICKRKHTFQNYTHAKLPWQLSLGGKNLLFSYTSRPPYLFLCMYICMCLYVCLKLRKTMKLVLQKNQPEIHMHADGHVLNYERMSGYTGLWVGFLGREGKFFSMHIFSLTWMKDCDHLDSIFSVEPLNGRDLHLKKSVQCFRLVI